MVATCWQTAVREVRHPWLRRNMRYGWSEDRDQQRLIRSGQAPLIGVINRGAHPARRLMRASASQVAAAAGIAGTVFRTKRVGLDVLPMRRYRGELRDCPGAAVDDLAVCWPTRCGIGLWVRDGGQVMADKWAIAAVGGECRGLAMEDDKSAGGVALTDLHPTGPSRSR